MYFFQEATFTLGLLRIWLCLTVVLTLLKLLLSPVIQGCLCHLFMSFWGLGHAETGQTVCSSRTFLSSYTLISADLLWFAYVSSHR